MDTQYWLLLYSRHSVVYNLSHIHCAFLCKKKRHPHSSQMLNKGGSDPIAVFLHTAVLFCGISWLATAPLVWVTSSALPMLLPPLPLACISVANQWNRPLILPPVVSHMRPCTKKAHWSQLEKACVKEAYTFSLPTIQVAPTKKW